MGCSNWDSVGYSSYSRSVSHKSTSEIFTSASLAESLNPAKFLVRESCDSPENPESTPIIIGVDVTGSMGHLATEIVKTGLGIIMENIISRKPVTDPHVLLACIGDGYVDSAPIQATQFEADVVLVKQIEQFYIEGGGGGNNGESYLLAWWLAVNKTKCDAFVKRAAKGYVFTIGDERNLDELPAEQIKRFFGVGDAPGITAAELLRQCQENWNVFHLIVPTSATDSQGAIKHWKELLGERAIVIDDWKKLSEVIVSIMQVNEGQSKEEVADSWDSGTREIVSAAVASLPDTKKSLPVKTEIQEI
jgi:uncharacterized protein YegL